MMGMFLAFATGLTAFIATMYLHAQGMLFPCLMKLTLTFNQSLIASDYPSWLKLIAPRIATALTSGLLTGVFAVVIFSMLRDSRLGSSVAAAITIIIVLSAPSAVIFLGSGQLALAVLLIFAAFCFINNYDETNRLLSLFGAGIAMAVAGILHLPFIPSMLLFAFGYTLFTTQNRGQFLATQSILVFPLAFSAWAMDYLYQLHSWSKPALKSALQPIGLWDWPLLTMGLIAVGLLYLAVRAKITGQRWITLILIVFSWVLAVVLAAPTEPGSILAVLVLGISSIVLSIRIASAGTQLSIALILLVFCASWLEVPAIYPFGQAMHSLRNGQEFHLMPDDWATAKFIAGHGPVTVDGHHDMLAVRYYLYKLGSPFGKLIEVLPDEGFVFNSRIRLVPVTEGVYQGQTILFQQGRWRAVREVQL